MHYKINYEKIKKNNGKEDSTKSTRPNPRNTL